MVPSSQEDVSSPISVSVYDVNYGRLSVDKVSGSPFPTIGRGNISLSSGMDQLCVGGESFVPGVASVSAVRDVSLFFVQSFFSPLSSCRFWCFLFFVFSSSFYSGLFPLFL